MGNSFKLYIAMVLVAMIVGCGSNRTGDVSPAPVQQPTAGQLDLPAPVDALALIPDRTSSALLLERNGSDYVPGLAQLVTDEDSSATYSPNWTDGSAGFSDLAYAIYNFNVEGFAGNQTLDFAWGTALDSSNLWLGFSNWNNNNWQWYPGSSADFLDLGNEGFADFTKPTSELLVVVVALGITESVLDCLRIGVQGWQTQTPDSTGSVGLYTSLCVVDGNPAISYYDGVNEDLKYVRATNAAGSS